MNKLIFIILILSLNVFAKNYIIDNKITCHVTKIVTLTLANEEQLKLYDDKEFEIKKENYIFYVNALNSDDPILIGDKGDLAILIKIETYNSIYLIEKTSGNHINLLVIFLDSKQFTFYKSYQIVYPLSYIMKGYYE